jgi:hypothetical protein
MSKPHLSEALLYFLDEKRVCLDVEFPDTGIGHAYKMTADEWNLLLKIWDKFSDDWHHAITYFAGYSYLKDSGALLTKALYKEDEEIIQQALLSIYESVSAELEEVNHEREENGEETTSKFNYTFSKEDLQKILHELDLRKSEFKLLPELSELKTIMQQQ